ncbi:MAG TPA: ABC transporter substrate-binding protein [Spirochaetia bacterium]|nr:ABC transporter substrate-binding protein [Spirochaetia bacterium]
MNATVRAALGALAVCGAALLAGCGLGLESPLRLVTNRAEMAAYVDRFNALQSEVKVEISYQESPAQAVTDGVSGDVVIGEWLATPAVMDRLEGLGDVVKPGKIDPAWFYARLLAMGSRDNRPMLVPLSFSLPALVYERQTPDLPAMLLQLDTLQAMSKAFNHTSKAGVVTNLGFSPTWNEDFLTLTALLFGAHLRPGRNGLPAWDENGLRRAVDFTRQWLEGVNGGADVDAAFSERNLVQPWYKLISSGKTLFALASFRDFFAVPEEERRDFDFRWLSQDGTVPVMDDVLFAGVLRTSRDKAGAKAFLQWFCSLPVQLSLLQVNQSRRIGVFGITDGFPAWKSIDEKDLPAKYPLLLGHIPMENLLTFPDTLPDNWVRVRDAVVEPWMLDTASGKTTDTLEKRLQDWQDAQKK